MKKAIIFIQCLVAMVLMVSCEKEPYAAANLTYESVLRVFDRDYADADGLHAQTTAQQAIVDLDPLYNLYFFLERPQIVCYSGMDYSGCTVEAITNFIDDSKYDEYYSLIFDRAVTVNEVDMVLTYKIFYYVDRSVQYTETYDSDGYIILDTDGTPLYDESYLEGYIEIFDESGNTLVRNDDIQILLEKRAVE